jgi:hypothetical protein
MKRISVCIAFIFLALVLCYSMSCKCKPRLSQWEKCRTDCLKTLDASVSKCEALFREDGDAKKRDSCLSDAKAAYDTCKSSCKRFAKGHDFDSIDTCLFTCDAKSAKALDDCAVKYPKDKIKLEACREEVISMSDSCVSECKANCGDLCLHAYEIEMAGCMTALDLDHDVTKHDDCVKKAYDTYFGCATGCR